MAPSAGTRRPTPSPPQKPRKRRPGPRSPPATGPAAPRGSQPRLREGSGSLPSGCATGAGVLSWKQRAPGEQPRRAPAKGCSADS